MRDELSRAAELLALAERARRHGPTALSDDELLELLAEQRWALGRLAARAGSLELRSTLNAAALKAHGAIHARPARTPLCFGSALRRVAGSLAAALLSFVGCGLVAASAVLADPVLAYAIVPREMLLQIDAQAWGARGGAGADVGMTLFYWANNLRASFLALGLGVLAGVPALLVVAYNGVMLGAVVGAAVSRGVGERLLGWVAPHGVPELSALVLCGAVGFELGRAWLSPGALRRRDALAQAGRDLLPLAFVGAALVVCAAPLEGFVAPLELPAWLDLGIATGWLLALGAGAWHVLRRERREAG